MDTTEARNIAKSRAKNAVLPSERKTNHAPIHHVEHDEAGHPSETITHKRTRAPKREDSFLVQFRVPAKYEFSATMAALMARSNGEFELGNRRDPKSAYLEHLLYQMLDEMLEDFPAVKGKK